MEVTNRQMNLWQAIDELAKQIPFSKDKVENVLSVRLNEVEHNTYRVFLEGGPVDFADGRRIANVDLRVGFDPGNLGFLVLSIEGACVSLEQVRARYGSLEVTDRPRGRSLDEMTSHSIQLPWGKLSFGFTVRNPECLASIVLNPRKDR